MPTHFPITCNPGNIQSIRHGGHYLAPFNASYEARRYLFFLLIYREGLPTTSPLRRRTLSIPPSIMSISPSPTTKASVLLPTALTTYTTIFISATPHFPRTGCRTLFQPSGCHPTPLPSLTPPNPTQTFPPRTHIPSPPWSLILCFLKTRVPGEKGCLSCVV